ncbi:MAG: hypothetical protein ABI663_03815 [Chryseolinea sp.]
MGIIKRMQAPTPKFFRVLRMVGIALTAAGSALLVAPVALPAIVISIAGYVSVAGAVVTAVSQTTVQSEEPGSAG